MIALQKNPQPFSRGAALVLAASLMLFAEVSQGTGETFNLSFPLADRDPMNATIYSVFDHSMTNSNARDQLVVTFSGETGSVVDLSAPRVEGGVTNYYSFKKPDGGVFVVNGHYRSGNSTSLYYDGHTGYDYRTTEGDQDPSNGRVNVFAAADGIAHNGWDGANALYIDHGNGYETHYVHLFQRLVADGAAVTRGQVIGISGDTGATGNPHLHFEVRLNGIEVDPYGWTGEGADPYTRAPNLDLWNIQGVPIPTISSVSPNPVFGSTTQQTVTIFGTNFVNKPTVMLAWTGENSFAVPTNKVTFVSVTELNMVVSTSTNSDTWKVWVINPDGRVSTQAAFAVVGTEPIATPIFSPGGGTYGSAQNVTLTSSAAGATITFTTNGSSPTLSSTLYTGAIPVTSSVTIKARAFKTNYTESLQASAVYTITVPAPSAPLGVSASDGAFSNQVVVTWDAAAGASSYEVWRGTAAESSSASKLQDTASPACNDTSALPGTVYYYRVKAKNSGGTSGFSESDIGYRQGPAPVQSTTLINSASGKSVQYVMNVPQGCDELVVETAGGSGDLSLYARYGSKPSSLSQSKPTAGTFDAFSAHPGSTVESIRLPFPASGKWYVTLMANAACSNVSLSTNYGSTVIAPITYGGGTNLPGVLPSNSEVYYSLVVSNGLGLLVVELSSTNAVSSDLYLRRGALPTSTVYDRASKGSGKARVLIYANPLPGTWYLMGRSAASTLAMSSNVLSTGAAYIRSTAGGLLDTSHGEMADNTRIGEAVITTASNGLYRVPVRISERNSGVIVTNRARYWTVLHGENSAGTNLSVVAAALDAAATNDQTLLVDWREGASTNLSTRGLVNIKVDQCTWIAAVGKTAAEMLKGLGASATKLNMAGHGSGAYVGYEISKANKANLMVALDPSGGSLMSSAYSTSKIKWSSYASYSWAFSGYYKPGLTWVPGPFANATAAALTKNNFTIHMDYTSDPTTLHNDAHRAFAAIIDSNGFVAFQPAQLTTNSHPWIDQNNGIDGVFNCTGSYSPSSFQATVTP